MTGLRAMIAALAIAPAAMAADLPVPEVKGIPAGDVRLLDGPFKDA